MFNISFNRSCVEPRITIVRDAAAESKYDSNVVVGVAELPAALAARNVATSTPLYVTYETSAMLSMVVIDTPALSADGQTDALLLPLIQGAGEARSRYVVCVEEAGAWPSAVAAWARRSNLVGCVGVYTEARRHFAALGGRAALTKYVADRPGTYQNHAFVTLLPAAVAGGLARGAYRAALCKADALTRAAAAGLDRRLEAFVGVARLRAVVGDLVLAAFRQAVPAIRQGHSQLQRAVEQELAGVTRQEQALAPQRLRGLATTAGTAHYQFMQSLLEGTVENLLPAHHATFGETLAEECAATAGGAWPTTAAFGAGTCTAPSVGDAPSSWQVPAATRRLLGRQQFERLLAEFRAVVQRTAMAPLTRDEIVTACGGASAATGVRALAACAAALAAQRLDAQVLPLVAQFCRRVAHVLARLADTADDVARAIRRNTVGARAPPPATAAAQELAGDFPFFRAWLGTLYRARAADALAAFEARCRAEFVAAPVLAWALLAQPEPPAALREYRPGADAVAAVRALADAVFVRARDRIGTSVLLRCYDYFLDRNTLWARVVEQLNDSIADDTLAELFEVDATRRRLQHQARTIQGRLDSLVAQDKSVAKAAFAIGAK